jgi:hypothetical protein
MIEGMVERFGSRAGSGSIPLIKMDPDPEGLKTCGSGGSGTLVKSQLTSATKSVTWKKFGFLLDVIYTFYAIIA